MDLIAKAVTLKSIKLNDPTAKNLLFSAKHSVLYTFDPQSCSWEKTETEGCLAIYKRAKLLKNLPTIHVLFILNRLLPENFTCPLSEVQSVQLEGDLLILLLKNAQVMGIWLFDEKERQLALDVLQSKLNGTETDSDHDIEDNDSANTSSTAQLKPISVTDLLGGSKASPSPTPTPSILDILSKAKMPKSTSRPSSLETEITENFKDLPSETSLKVFTDSVCLFLRSNPQLLASLHSQLTTKKQ